MLLIHKLIFGYMHRMGLIRTVEGLRDDLEAAFKEHSAEAAGDGAPATSPAPAEPAARDDGRQSDGRWAPRTPAKEQVPADGQQGHQGPQGTGQPGQVAAPTAPPKQGDRAPVTWKPEEREGWETLPAHTRQAIARRELETQQALSRSDDARRFHQEVSQALAPYQHILATENATPAQAISSLFQTAAALRTAPPGQKAALVADMCMQFGVDIRSLDNELDRRVNGNQHPANPMDAIQRAIDQRLAPVQQFIQGYSGQQAAASVAMQQDAARTWDAFVGDPANEFANDVRDYMADLLEVAANRGQVLSLQDAYKAATLAHPTISTLVQNRQQAAGAQQQTAAARRAQEAAASIPSGGAPSQSDQDQGDGSVRSDLLSSIKALNQRRA